MFFIIDFAVPSSSDLTPFTHFTQDQKPYFTDEDQFNQDSVITTLMLWVSFPYLA